LDLITKNKIGYIGTKLSILFYGKRATITDNGLMPIYLRGTVDGERFGVRKV